jgi:hypothetical protein
MDENSTVTNGKRLAHREQRLRRQVCPQIAEDLPKIRRLRQGSHPSDIVALMQVKAGIVATPHHSGRRLIAHGMLRFASPCHLTISLASISLAPSVVGDLSPQLDMHRRTKHHRFEFS